MFHDGTPSSSAVTRQESLLGSVPFCFAALSACCAILQRISIESSLRGLLTVIWLGLVDCVYLNWYRTSVRGGHWLVGFPE